MDGRVKRKTFADLMAEAALQGTTTSDLAELLKGAGVSLPDAGLGPVSPASRAGRADSIAPTQETQRPNDYMAPVAELLSIPMGAYGAGQLVGSGINAAREGDYASGAGQVALGMAGMLPMAPKGGKGIRAFHGSPHDFDRFSMEHIGKGEGAQAYGHGLYFAEAEDVAKAYRDALAKLPEPDAQAMQGVQGKLAEIDAQIAEYAPYAASSPAMQRQIDLLNDSRDALLRQAAEETQARAPSGHMYEVNINADPEDFLDWDKPLSEQSGKAKAYFENLRGLGVDVPENATGRELWETLSLQEHRNLKGKVNDFRGVPKGLTEQMQKEGIPGIRYLDQMSRGAGEGSSNYVIFDDAIIDIVRKYGIAGLALLQAAGYGTNEGEETQ